MNTTSILIFVITLGVSQAFSQRDSPVGESFERAVRTASWLKEKLSLTDRQVSKVQDILKRSFEGGEKERADSTVDKKAMRRVVRTRVQSTEKEITALLTTAQLRRYMAIKAKLRRNLEDQWGEKRGMGM